MLEEENNNKNNKRKTIRTRRTQRRPGRSNALTQTLTTPKPNFTALGEKTNVLTRVSRHRKVHRFSGPVRQRRRAGGKWRPTLQAISPLQPAPPPSPLALHPHLALRLRITGGIIPNEGRTLGHAWVCSQRLFFMWWWWWWWVLWQWRWWWK